MLTVLGGLAEFERELIRARTGEGRERAKARGVRLGRKPKLNQHQQQEALARRDAGEPVTEIARSYDVHHATILAPAIMAEQARHDRASPAEGACNVMNPQEKRWWTRAIAHG